MLGRLPLNESQDNRGLPLPPLLKFLVALRFYGCGAFQTVVGDLVNVSQPEVSQTVWEITQAIALHLYPTYVRFPNAAEMPSVMARFYKIAGFQGVTGYIDCTHILVRRPRGNDAEVYRNRKAVFSINVQASATSVHFKRIMEWLMDIKSNTPILSCRPSLGRSYSFLTS